MIIESGESSMTRLFRGPSPVSREDCYYWLFLPYHLCSAANGRTEAASGRLHPSPHSHPRNPPTVSAQLYRSSHYQTHFPDRETERRLGDLLAAT